MLKGKRKLLLIPIIIIIIVAVGCVYAYINTRPISSKSVKVTIEIKEGNSIKDIVKILDEKELIRSELFTLMYAKVHGINDAKAGVYELNKNQSLKELFETLRKGSNVKKDVSITFTEGKNMRYMAKVIEENTTNTKEDVFNLLADKEYIKSLIEKYWFLEDVILDENIYYPLEGYLAPDTYFFEVNTTVKEIFTKLLDQTDTILTKYKEQIQNSPYSVHQILTLASMVETEGVSLEDRENIAGVFINRLNYGMSLGSDVTTYYAAKVDLGERDLYQSELDSTNPYNTRSASSAGKLPIGPICNPSSEAINAAVNYKQNNYLYFVADKNMKVYFNETDAGHNETINELKASDLWYEY